MDRAPANSLAGVIPLCLARIAYKTNFVVEKNRDHDVHYIQCLKN